MASSRTAHALGMSDSSLDGGGEEGARAGTDWRGGCWWNVEGRVGEELSVEIFLDAAAPGADETEIESAADSGAGERD